MKIFPHFQNQFLWKKRKQNKENPQRIPRGANPYRDAMIQIGEKVGKYEDLFGENVTVRERTRLWNKFDSLWDPYRDKYAWAVPDERALRIIAAFSPVLEIGSGKGYWAALVRNMGYDIAAYDKYVDKRACWTEVREGGPEKVLKYHGSGRSLLLCFPDEQESIAIQCLENFDGECIIHVGELAIVGTNGEAPQAPFGITTSRDFQVALLQSFHCILVANLEVQAPFSRECITVWKRTKYVLGRRFGDDGNISSSDSEDDGSDDSSIGSGSDSGSDRIIEDSGIHHPQGGSHQQQAAFDGFVSAAELARLRGDAVTTTSENSVAKKLKTATSTTTTKTSAATATSGGNTTTGGAADALVGFMSKEELALLRGGGSQTTNSSGGNVPTTKDISAPSVNKKQQQTQQKKKQSIAGTDSTSNDDNSSSSVVVGFMSKEELARLRGEVVVSLPKDSGDDENKIGDDDEKDNDDGDDESFDDCAVPPDHMLMDSDDDEDDEEEDEEEDEDDYNSGEDDEEDEDEAPPAAAVSFISKSELERLRGRTSNDDDFETNTRKRKYRASSIQEERERVLDEQYYETNEKRWASIPSSEMLPVDRAAPCLRYLL